MYRGWPVELFVQTQAAWHRFADQETAKRSSPLLAMCSDGMLLVDTDGLGASLQAEARKRWAAGPPPLSDRERDYQRYILTDLLDDLRGCADPAERVHLVAHMLQRASQLVLLVGGHWLGGGKWLSRRLAAADPGLHRTLTGGAAQAFTGDASVFAAAVTEVLDRAAWPAVGRVCRPMSRWGAATSPQAPCLLQAGSVGYGGSFLLGSGQIEFGGHAGAYRPRQGGPRDLQP